MAIFQCKNGPKEGPWNSWKCSNANFFYQNPIFYPYRCFSQMGSKSVKLTSPPTKNCLGSPRMFLIENKWFLGLYIFNIIFWIEKGLSDGNSQKWYLYYMFIYLQRGCFLFNSINIGFEYKQFQLSFAEIASETNK